MWLLKWSLKFRYKETEIELFLKFFVDILVLDLVYIYIIINKFKSICVYILVF